jgi:hypothetical protein
MEKPRILISCNARSLVLAGRLRDELHKRDCDTALWSDDGRSQSSAALLELLDRAAEQFDFAAIILVKDDLKVRETDDPLSTRDTYDFQAGVFMATIGRERCFLVNSIGDAKLRSHLGGIISIPFEEPTDLTDLAACERAVASVATELARQIRQHGRSPYYVRVPNLSIAEVWRKERHFSEGGDLREGDVVVCETQPLPQESLAAQVRRNIDNGIFYTYFLYFSADTIHKICRALQVILVTGVDAELASDFTSRISVVKGQKKRILKDLWDLCHDKKLQITLLFQEPPMNFRVHNASNVELAKLYARYRDQCFIPWSEGTSAQSIWRSLPTFLADNERDRLFVSLKVLQDDKVKRHLFESSLERAVCRFFPGSEVEVKRLLTGVAS